MKKLFIFLLILVNLSVHGQDVIGNRIIARQVLLLPSDTTNNKTINSLSSINGVSFIKTPTKWLQIGTDTTSLSNRINLKINISDTAAMLTPYARTANVPIYNAGYGLTLGASVFKVDSTSITSLQQHQKGLDSLAANYKFQNLTVDPTTPPAGKPWLNTTTNRLRVQINGAATNVATENASINIGTNNLSSGNLSVTGTGTFTGAFSVMAMPAQPTYKAIEVASVNFGNYASTTLTGTPVTLKAFDYSFGLSGIHDELTSNGHGWNFTTNSGIYDHNAIYVSDGVNANFVVRSDGLTIFQSKTSDPAVLNGVTDPRNGIGGIYFNSSINRWKGYNGSAWKAFAMQDENAFFNTITINPTLTTTSNAQIINSLGGTITARSVASDIIYGYNTNPTITSGATNQTLYGHYINPTLNNTQITGLGAITGGTGYVNGTYNGVALTGGAGAGATANITVTASAVSAVTIVNGGQNYAVGNTLSASTASIGGGTGSGFSIPVSAVGYSGITSYALGVNGASLLASVSYSKSVGVDANYAVGAYDYYIILPAITLGRTVTLPTASANTGRALIIVNTNTSANAWTYATAITLADGTTTTAITNARTIKLFSDGTVWRRESETL